MRCGMFHPRGKSALLIATALVLAACAGPANNAATSASQPPTAESINAPVTPSSSAAQPTSAAPAATQSAVSSRAVKSIIGAMTEPAVVQTADASTSAQPVEVPSTEPLKAPTPPL